MKFLPLILFVLLFQNFYSQFPDLITDFRQTAVKDAGKEFQSCNDDDEPGNCVAIALIKCALGQFGNIESIFKSFEKKPDESYAITFADNMKITIDANDIKTVKDLTGIVPANNSSYYKDALIIYAAICKRIYLNRDQYVKKEDGKERQCILNFTNAVEYLNSGYETKEAYKLLDLDSIQISIQEVSKEKNAVIWCSAHAAYSSMGIQDRAGKGVPLQDGKMRNLARVFNKSKIEGAYKLKKKAL